MMLGWLLVLLVILGIVRLLIRRPGGGGEQTEDRAEAALRERYARGEIDDETYRRMLAELRRR
jgi:putative membrane protein